MRPLGFRHHLELPAFAGRDHRQRGGLILILGAVFAPLVAPHNPFDDPSTLNLMEGFSRPGEPNAITGRTFVFGTDSQGAMCIRRSYTARAGRSWSALPPAVLGRARRLVGLLAGFVAPLPTR